MEGINDIVRELRNNARNYRVLLQNASGHNKVLYRELLKTFANVADRIEAAVFLAGNHEEYRLRVKPWPYSGWTTIGETCNSVKEASVLLEARKIFRDNDHAIRIERREVTDWQAVEEVRRD